MKKVVLPWLAVSLFFGSVAFSQKKATTYKVSGKIEGRDTGWIYLLNTAEGHTDSVRLKKGKFSFPGKLNDQVVYTLRLPDIQPRIVFFAGEGPVTISAKIDSMDKARVGGSALNEELKDFNKAWGRIHNTAGIYYRMSDSVYKSQGGKPDSTSRSTLEKAYQKLQVFARNIQDSFIRVHANSPVSAYVVDTRYAAYNEFDKVAEMFAVLGSESKNSYYGKKIKAGLDIAAKSAIGVIPVFEQADTSGKIIKLSDFRGSYVLVDFWASWCGPCRKENPNLVNAYNQYHSKGFNIIGLSLDDKKAPWLKAIEQDSLTWTHVSDLKGWKNAVAVAYGVNVVPTSFLIDKEGKIIAKNLRGEALEAKLSELLD